MDARDDAAQVVAAGVGRVGVADDRAEVQLPRSVARQLLIGAELAVELALDVHRLLLVVGVRDLRAGQAALLHVGLPRQQIGAEHPALAFVQTGATAEDKPVAAVLACQQAAAQVLRGPSGHNDNLHPAFFDTGQEGVGVPAPLFVQNAVVKRLLVVLDRVVDDPHRTADAGDRTAEAGRQVVEELALQAPQLCRRVALFDARRREDVVEDRHLAVDLVGVNAVADVSGETPGQNVVI